MDDGAFNGYCQAIESQYGDESVDAALLGDGHRFSDSTAVAGFLSSLLRTDRTRGLAIHEGFGWHPLSAAKIRTYCPLPIPLRI
jgi:hypothetical protein